MVQRQWFKRRNTGELPQMDENTQGVQNTIRTIIMWALWAVGFRLLIHPWSLGLADDPNALFFGITITGPILKTVIAMVVIFYITDLVTGMIYVLPERQRAIILRMGRYSGVKGPGVFLIMPYVWSVASVLSMRVFTEAIKATETLTKDNVPVDVEAVLYYAIDKANAHKA